MAKVVYIAGSTRSGSTLLGSVLGQLEGVFFAGELNRVWHPRERTAGLCSCGKRESECEVWSAIFKDAFGGIERVDIDKMRKLRDRYTLSRNFPFVLIGFYRKKIINEIKDFIDYTRALYYSIMKITNCHTIVDSSKSPLYAHLLQYILDIDFYVLHLVRDPRAVVFSWQRRKASPSVRGQILMPRLPLYHSALWWNAWNGMASLLGKYYFKNYKLIRYEDLCGDLLYKISEIIYFLNYDVKLHFIDAHRIYLKKLHVLRGNPDRFKIGLVDISIDEQWKANMKRLDKLMVTLLSFPLAHLYGYKVK